MENIAFTKELRQNMENAFMECSTNNLFNLEEKNRDNGQVNICKEWK
jgi:hypothetical protein